MTQPVRLSAELVQEARETGQLMERSIASQIEYWARLGRAIERSMTVAQAQTIKRRGDYGVLARALEDSDENREKFRRYLASRPFPHFEQDADGTLVKIDEDGTRTRGRFEGRVFRPEAER